MNIDPQSLIDALLPWIGGAAGLLFIAKVADSYRNWQLRSDVRAVLQEVRGLRRDLRRMAGRFRGGVPEQQ